MADAIDRAAHARGWDRSRLVEELVTRFLAEHEAEKEAAAKPKPKRKGRKPATD